MKKILSILLAAMMLLAAVPAMAYDDVASSDNAIAISLVTGMGIMPEESENHFGAETHVTRGDFAVYTAKLLRLQVQSGVTGKSVFEDVDISTEEGYAINTLVNQGVIAAAEKTYNPKEIISFASAADMLLNALGYAGTVKENGGYPGGTLKIAAQTSLSRGLQLTTNKTLTKKEAAILLYNAMFAETMHALYIGGNTTYISSGETFLEDKWDMEEVSGVMEGFGATTLTGKALGKDQISVDGHVFDCFDKRYKDYVGYMVKAYYSTSVTGEEEFVTLYAKSNANKVTKVDANDLYVRGNTVKYYVDNREKSLNVAEDAAVIYNGRYYTDYSTLEDVLSMEEGDATFIANGSTSKINVIVVNEYQHLLVDRVNTKTTTLYASNSGDKMPMYKSYKDDGNLEMTVFYNGEEITFDQIKEGDALTLMESPDGEEVRIYVSRETVTGTINSVTEKNGNQVIKVNNVEYVVSAYCTAKISGGDNLTLAITTNGQVLGITAAAGGNTQYAYVMKAYTDDDEEKSYVKLFTSDGMITTYSCDTKLKVNGTKIEKDVEDVIAQYDFVTYQLNTDGEVRSLNKPYDVSSNPDYYSETTFTKNWSKSSVRYIDGIMGRSLITENTVIFFVPRYDRDVASDYRIMTVKDLSNKTYSNVTCYDVDRNGRVGALLLKEDMSSTVAMSGNLFFINDVSSVLTADGEVGWEINGFEAGEAKSLVFTDDSQSITYEDGWMNYSGNEDFDTGYKNLHTGDAIQYSLDVEGKVQAYRLVYNNYQTTHMGDIENYNDPREYFEKWSKTGSVTKMDFYDNLFISYGDVQYRYNDYILELGLNQSEREAYANSSINLMDYYRPINMQKAYIYKFNIADGEVELGDLEDVNKGDTVFVRSKNMGEINEIMVYAAYGSVK